MSKIVKKIIYFCFILILSVQCSNKNERKYWEHIELYPKDSSQVITVISEKGKRYFMSGKHSTVPQDNYLSIDISEVGALGDGVTVCWNTFGLKWVVDNPYNGTIENKLKNTNSFYSSVDSEDIFLNNFNECDCGRIMLRENTEPYGNLKIKYIIPPPEFIYIW